MEGRRFGLNLAPAQREIFALLSRDGVMDFQPRSLRALLSEKRLIFLEDGVGSRL